VTTPLPTTLTTAGDLEVVVREATADDHRALLDLFNRTVAATGGYPQEVPIDADAFAAYWLAGKAAVVVAEADGELVGSYFVKANHPGRAAHIANAGYLVGADQQGRGIGRALVAHSLDLARALGFDAMQFNLVFASNPARPMYEDLGFAVVGRVPDAVDGEDALIYWRRL
jgi:L-amino acid N-acyltransferase YncA